MSELRGRKATWSTSHPPRLNTYPYNLSKPSFRQVFVTQPNEVLFSIWKYKNIDMCEECFQIWLATTSVRNVDKRHAQIRNLCKVCLLHAFHKPPRNWCSWDHNTMYEGVDCKSSKNSSDSEYIHCHMVRARKRLHKRLPRQMMASIESSPRGLIFGFASRLRAMEANLSLKRREIEISHPRSHWQRGLRRPVWEEYCPLLYILLFFIRSAFLITALATNCTTEECRHHLANWQLALNCCSFGHLNR